MTDSMQIPSETIPNTPVDETTVSEIGEIAIMKPAVANDTLTPLAEILLRQSASDNEPVVPGAASARSHTSQDESRELSALLHGVAATDLGLMSQIAIVGQDRLRWLNGMVTNSIQALEEGRGNYNFVLNVQGRIQGDAYIYRSGERLLLHTTRSQTKRLMEHLDHFVIMDDVELKPSTGLTALGLIGPGSAELLASLGVRQPRISQSDLAPLTLAEVEVAGVKATLIRSFEVLTPHYELWFDRGHVLPLWQALLGAGATSCSAAAAETLRILEGIPAYGVDLRDRDLAQETGQVRALNFNKGCYLGQEIVERIRSRGNVHRVFLQMELTGTVPAPPTDLRMDGKVMGTVTSAASIQTPEGPRILALGFLRSETLAALPHIQIAYDGGTAVPLDKTALPAEFALLRAVAGPL